jgi:glycosyltransferase involved in cell wall biosynthesis
MKSEFPFFTIVIPTYNHGHFIRKCLESVLNQTYTRWEIIVVNNYSEDNTVEVVKSFSDSRIRLVNFSNEGIIAASRNKGIELANGDWICFLDSDDLFYSNKLEELLGSVMTSDVIYHDLDMYSDSKLMWKKKVKGRELKGNIEKDLIINGNALPCSSVAVRKNILNAVSGFSEDQNLFAVEDSDCWIRIARITSRFKYINKGLGKYWIGNNTSVSVKQINREQKLFNAHCYILSEIEKEKAQKNMFYRQARIFHKLKKYRQAMRKYQDSMSNLTSLRSIIMYCVSMLHIKV